jgi:hypothetical protein
MIPKEPAMDDVILLGRGRQMVEFPRSTWERRVAEVPQHMATRLAFMSEAHHRVRYFVVGELPRSDAPLTADVIAQALSLPVTQVEAVLDDLERNLFFLVRNKQGAVRWAFPVTLDETPHALRFDTGERCNAA